MELSHLHAQGFTLKPRAKIPETIEVEPSSTLKKPTTIMRFFARRDEECHATAESNTCEKPAGGISIGIPIAVGVVVVILIGCFLFILHRRNMKRQALEEMKDPHKSLDFGLGGEEVRKKAGRKSLLFGGGEKGLSHKQSQLSMDMNLSSPYLLPPTMQQSRESLNSLARTLGPDHVTILTETTSSFANDKRGSNMSNARTHPPRQNSLPRTPVSPSDGRVDPFATPTVPEPAHKVPSSREADQFDFPVKPIVPEIGTIHSPSERSDSSEATLVSSIQQPPPAKSPVNGLPSPSFGPPQIELPPIPSAVKDDGLHMSPAPTGNGLGLDFDFPKPLSAADNGPMSAPLENNFQAYQPEIRTSQYFDDEAEEDRGRSAARTDGQQPQGLGVPQQSNKRLSVGFRPLPPDEVTESEDPEYRANRIRSFYKEYFEELAEPAPPVPAIPKNHAAAPPAKPQQAQYYEDYDQSYLQGEEAAYFDPETNAFVMPYAQPVTRRAMTPPPTNRRGPPGGAGPRGPPGHFPTGSTGGMPGGPRGRPRAGSAFGPRGPRGSSAVSSRAPSSLGPRPDSSASARANRQPPKKMGPPPAPLTTLPTPSKLKDDSFSILNAIDFAPPNTLKDAAAGRSQSPLGERRPYQPKVLVASPLVTAFEELAALPSPHLLRKSSTFTGLDFAPPKKFQDNNDHQSDAGSIRSQRSGISTAQLSAIRNGAGRVSRLPGDTVFTSASATDQLKPSWGMRN